ncbi:MAG: sulfatase-like hydrolase/transferase [Acidobacteria bacterium]|nr:sulfatase-like hydrolase/transferase [Acidobacteriota bacterium]MCI0719103.1 sulfatase-like hydrolase/transferase [Acidobacteriota bacterium]
MRRLPVTFCRASNTVLGVATVYGLLLASAIVVEASSSQTPNIVVLLADDLGYADISLHGGREVSTPNIDSLADNGIRCSNGYVSGPYCSPTRAGLLTGRYQQRFGHEFNPALLNQGGQGQGLALAEKTLADRLKAAGYTTGLVGKWHLGEEDRFHPLKRGFVEFFGFLTGSHSYFETDDPTRGPILGGRQRAEFKGYLTDVLAEKAAAFVERNKQKPFFLYLAFNAVHTPMHAPDRLLQRFERISDMKRRTYLAMTAALDEAVGTLLRQLRQAGLEERTLIFFLSDNGGPTTKFAANGSGNAPLRGSKGDTWEGGIRVPFLLQWKDHLAAGKIYERPVIALDIAPTALAAAGVKLKPEWKLDGVDLLPFLQEKRKEDPHEALFWRFGSQMAVRQGDWKLVRASRGLKEYEDITTEPMLFNLAADIAEQRDLAAQSPGKARDLQALWDRWNRQLAAPRWPATVGGKPVRP